MCGLPLGGVAISFDQTGSTSGSNNAFNDKCLEKRWKNPIITKFNNLNHGKFFEDSFDI